MDTINLIKLGFAGVGTAISAFIGEVDVAVTILIYCVIADYISGVIASAVEGKLSAKVGFLGIVKKIFIFLLVGIAHQLDQGGLTGEPIIKLVVCWFYIGNEGLSITENVSRLGVPVPKILITLFENAKTKGEKDNG